MPGHTAAETAKAADTFEDPDLPFVFGALKTGSADASMFHDARWTNQQKERFKTRFDAHVDFIRETSETKAAERETRRSSRLERAEELAGQPPVLREVVAGAKLGAADIASLAISPFSTEDADLVNRMLDEEVAAHGALTDSTLLGGVLSASRSIATAVPLAATGAGTAGVIAGFAGSAANQARTEATDAGLTGKALRRHVGRAALIEGGIAGAFQLIPGGGAFEKAIVGGGISKLTVGKFARGMGLELIEENATEIASAYNNAFGGITGPVTAEQAKKIFIDTSVATIMGLGTAQAFQGIGSQDRRDSVIAGWSERFGFTKAQGEAIIAKASKGLGNFEEKLERGIEAERRIAPEAMADLVFENRAVAEGLAGTETPSRKQWKDAGLPDMPKEVRQDTARLLGSLLEFSDAQVGFEAEEATVGEPAPLVGAEAATGPFAPPAAEPPGGAIVTPQPGPLEVQEPAAPTAPIVAEEKPVPQPQEPEEAPAAGQEVKVTPPAVSPGRQPPAVPTARPKAAEPQHGPEVTSARKATLNRDRADFELNTLDSPERRSFQESLDTARTRGISEPRRAMLLADEAIASPRAFDDVETAGLVIHANQLKIEHRAVFGTMKKASDLADLKDLSAKARDIENDFERLSRALIDSGTEKGRALASQKITLDANFDLLSVKVRARAAKGKDLTTKETAQLEELVADLEARAERAEALNAELNDKLAEQALKDHKNATKRRGKKSTKAKFDEKLKRAKELLAKGCLF